MKTPAPAKQQMRLEVCISDEGGMSRWIEEKQEKQKRYDPQLFFLVQPRWDDHRVHAYKACPQAVEDELDLRVGNRHSPNQWANQWIYKEYFHKPFRDFLSKPPNATHRCGERSVPAVKRPSALLACVSSLHAVTGLSPSSLERKPKMKLSETPLTENSSPGRYWSQHPAYNKGQDGKGNHPSDTPSELLIKSLRRPAKPQSPHAGVPLPYCTIITFCVVVFLLDSFRGKI